MKKIILIPIIIIVVTIIMSLFYLASDQFEANNFDYLEVVDYPSGLSSEEHLTEFVDTLIHLDQLQEHVLPTSSEKTVTLVLHKKFGDPVYYNLELDYDFTYVCITELETGTKYKLEEQWVSWLYMQDVFADLYHYQSVLTHDIVLGGEILESYKIMDWSYQKGDFIWYDKKEVVNDVMTIETDSKELILEVVSQGQADSTVMTVFKDDQLLYEGDLNFTFEEKGQYDIRVKTKWFSGLYKGTSESYFKVNFNPEPTFSVSQTSIEQGETITITAKYIDDADLLFVDQSYLEGVHFSLVDDIYQCVIPSTYYTGLGQYSITYGYDDLVYDLEFEISERDYSTQHLTVDSQTTQSTQTTEAYAEYRKYYKTALLEDQYTPTQDFLNEPVFILPVTGRLTTEFGEERYVNGKKTSYHHAGYDIATERGTPVVATGDGKVVLAQFLTVTGNSVVISHGNGIFSTYFHLDSINTEADVEIEQGEQIATVGSTGFSTGPHLHFSISYYQMNLEPGPFIYGQKVTYDNYEALFKED